MNELALGIACFLAALLASGYLAAVVYCILQCLRSLTEWVKAMKESNDERFEAIESRLNAIGTPPEIIDMNGNADFITSIPRRHTTGLWIDGDDSEMTPGVWVEQLESGDTVAFQITEPGDYWLHSGRRYYRMGDMPELPGVQKG